MTAPNACHMCAQTMLVPSIEATAVAAMAGAAPLNDHALVWHRSPAQPAVQEQNKAPPKKLRQRVRQTRSASQSASGARLLAQPANLSGGGGSWKHRPPFWHTSTAQPTTLLALCHMRRVIPLERAGLQTIDSPRSRESPQTVGASLQRGWRLDD